jgi:RNA polymerase sigma-70 factor (ECF subfamily)
MEAEGAADSPEAEPPAFDRLVAAHQRDVLRLAYRLLGWSEDAEDVVQEVFLSVYRNLSCYRGDGSIRAWLARLTVNQCRTHQRRRILRWQLATGFWRQRKGEPHSTDHRIYEEERWAAVREAVKRLPQRDREVIVLRYFEEMPLEEIGRVLGTRVNAVEVRLHRARAKLEQRLRGVWEP